ncbi:iron-containing alcohol dehydrogenase family protein [Deltaproteobacteria bacterium TL4]
MMIAKIFKQVPRILFGAGTLKRLAELLPARASEAEYYIYVVDHVHQKTDLMKRIDLSDQDLLIWVDTTDEPKTLQVDAIKDEVVNQGKADPLAIIAIGGGSALDVGKALSVVLKNEGSSANYQGWDLVKNRAVFKVGIPTLSGTGAEASRTAVLTGVDKKFGINSDYSMFDAILCDSSLLKTVPKDQAFYTAMDCFIHCVESLTGTMINELSKAYAAKALELCKEALYEDDGDKLMVASYLGGASIVNSEVGICHALSYGLSLELGYHHGVANCIAFNTLESYYGEYVLEMREMLKKFGVPLPGKVTQEVNADMLERMVAMTLKMEKPLTNALGENWKSVFTPEIIIELYGKM